MLSKQEVITLPKYSTDVLNQAQIWFLSSRLPQPCKNTGRKPYSNIELLPGILQVLRSGCRWRDLDLRKGKNQASEVTHWRRLQFWRKSNIFPKLWQLILTRLRTKQKLNLAILAIDGTVIESFAFKDTTGYSGQKRKVSVRVASVVEQQGLPLTFTLETGNRIDIMMAQKTLNNLHIPKEWIFKSMLLTDRGYDSRAFRYYLRENCIKENIIQRIYAKHQLAYDLLSPHYNATLGKKRYVVERTNAWYKSFRKLKFRYDRTKNSFEAFLYLAALVICIRRLIY